MTEPVIPPKRFDPLVRRQLDDETLVPTQIVSEWIELVSRLLERLQVLEGSGGPEGVITATTNQMYRDTAGGSGTILYIKTTATGNTGWVLV